MTRLVRVLAIAAWPLFLAGAQDISGDWQGALKVGKQELRTILRISKNDTGLWTATLLSIDQSPDFGAGMATTSFSIDGSHIRFAIAPIRGSYDGNISADATSMSGTWTQMSPLPLEFRRPTKETAWLDPSPHTVQFIPVEKNVKLEVLDWGGSGPALVFIPGLGNSAHIFDKFALKLTATHHVYGITRRGFGASSVPSPAVDNAYAADRLGDDVLTVLDALKLNKPVLAGHSLGGEELSSVGSRHPEKVAGLIYLDAGYSYAFYDKLRGDLVIDLLDLEKKLDQLKPWNGAGNPRKIIEELLATTLPAFERELKEMQKNTPADSPGNQQPLPPVIQAIMAGVQKYTDVRVPALAIFAAPLTAPPPAKEGAAPTAAEARAAAAFAQANAFEKGIPSARVVRLPKANHYVFLSNEADVLREMNTFLSALP